MANKPLLLFPSRSKSSFDPGSGHGNADLKTPSRIVQIGRINVMFKKVEEAFENRRVLVENNPDGLAPEMVLVFETLGTINDFFKAVGQIPELKWLGEQEAHFPPSDEFYHEKKPSKPIIGKLYFVLVNNAALKQLRSQWNTWKSKKQKFEIGLTKWKHLFNLLNDIRPWGVKDRLEETGILMDLDDRIKRNEEVIFFEVELWYRKSRNQRNMIKQKLNGLVNIFGGQFLQECIIEEIGYHAILVKSPISIFNTLNQQNEVKFFQSSEIMQIRPVGQTIFRYENIDEPNHLEYILPHPQQLGSPVVALLDGVPVQNHSTLSSRLDILDPDEFEKNYPAERRIHATGMASIIIHGDLNNANEPIKSKLLVRPVMHYYKYHVNEGEERIPEHFLVLDIIHRAVKEIAEIAPSVKVINLSLGDKYKVFEHSISTWARLVDWLSEKYNLLFIVSAGNVDDDIVFDNNGAILADLLANPGLLSKSSIKYFYSKNRFRKIISPGESINALTIGACHEDASEIVNLNHRIDLFDSSDMISPISRMGLGYRRSIKPDVLASGGRILFRNVGNNSLRLMSKAYAIPPGFKVATPSEGLNGTRFSWGTSNAAAFVSHISAKIYESFQEDPALLHILNQDFFAVAAKSLIVHSASWNESTVASINDSVGEVPNKKELVSRFLGYGKINPGRIAECTDKRVTLIGVGLLKPEDAFLYELPLPEELGGITEWRKLIVTLAWLSPINSDNQLYRTHKLWFDFPGNDYDRMLKAKRAHYDDDAVRRGTVQHEVFYSDQAQPIENNSVIRIKVNCKAEASKYDLQSFSQNKLVKSVKYALAVTLELDPNIPVDIYELVTLRIKQPIKPI